MPTSIPSPPDPLRRRLRIYTEDEADDLIQLAGDPARSLREITPTERTSYVRPRYPTDHAPGTPAKLQVLRQRYKHREQFWHPADARIGERSVIAAGVWDVDKIRGKPTLDDVTEVDQVLLAELEDAREAREALRRDSRFDAVARAWLVPSSQEYQDRVTGVRRKRTAA